MTTEQLNKGHDIKDEISILKYALIQTNKAEFFRSDSCGNEVNPFLSALSVSLRQTAVVSIKERMELLEKRFAEL